MYQVVGGILSKILRYTTLDGTVTTVDAEKSIHNQRGCRIEHKQRYEVSHA